MGLHLLAMIVPLMMMPTETLKLKASYANGNILQLTVGGYVACVCVCGGEDDAECTLLHLLCDIQEKQRVMCNVHDAITWTHSTNNYVLQHTLVHVHCTTRINISSRMHPVNTLYISVDYHTHTLND